MASHSASRPTSEPIAPPRIRWDRLSRAALLLLFAFILVLALRPLGSYWGSWQEAQVKRDDVARLRAENRELRQRRAALSGQTALEREARRLGMVKVGERAYALRGLPKD